MRQKILGIQFHRPSLTEWVCLIAGMFFAYYYAWIMDDAYIYFRYADNFVFLKHGLVYNPGEYVEGFSSPAWMLLLLVFRYLGVNYWMLIKVIAVLTFIVFWYFIIIVNRELTSNGSRKFVFNFPLIHLTFTYGIMCYFSSGLESPLVLITASAYACFILYPRSVVFASIVGISPLIRHELFIPFLVVIFGRLLLDKRIPYISILAFIISMGGYMLFRIYYYADLFPNTFYLKNEQWISQGLLYIYDTVLPYFTVPILGSFLVCYNRLTSKDRRLWGMQRILMLLTAIPVVLYVIKIGGDPRHFRYLAFPYCLFIIATGGLVEELINSLHVFNRKSCLILALLIMLGTGMCYPRQLLHHPIYSHPSYASPKILKTDHRGFFKIRDALVHRFYYTPSFSNNGSAIELKQIMIKWKAQKTPIPQSRILTTPGCLQAYKAFDSYIIQDLGLTEPFLARTIMKSNRPAHKQGLRPLAQDIAQVRKQYSFRKGGFEEMVKSGEAPLWIRNNLGTIQAIENKVYNDHHFGENIFLALRPVGKINP